MPCDPTTLAAAAKCFECLSEDDLSAIYTQLLCQRANASSSGIKDSFQGDNISSFSLARASNRIWGAQRFIASSSYTATKFVLALAKTGTPPFTIVGSIYTHDSVGGQPLAQIGSPAPIFDPSSLNVSPSYTDVAFAGLNAPLITGTTYWLVLAASVIGSAVNFVNVRTSTFALLNNIEGDDDGIPPWNNQSNTQAWNYAVYN